MRFLALSFWAVLPVWGASIDFSGTITATDPTFDRPSSASVLSGRQTAYQTFSFVAGAGPWSVSGDYTAGGAAYGGSVGLEGFLYLYTSFDPQNPLADLVGADDDEDVDGAGAAARQDFSLIASSDSFGSGVSGNILTLVPGQTYTVVVTSYEEPGSTTFGPIGVGAFHIHVEGVEAVPEPGTCGLAACALAWAIFRRRCPPAWALSAWVVMSRVLLAAWLAVTCAFGIPVTVLNPSFEIATLPMTYSSGDLNNLVSGTIPLGGTVANWSATGAITGDNVGVFNPNNADPSNWSAVWETGNNVGYTQNFATGTTSAGLRQILTDTYQANTAYALTVDIGRRTFSLGPMGYSLELWAGGSPLGTASHLSLPLDSAGTDALNLFVGAGDAAVGQAIEIRLMSQGVFSEAYFDNVRLDATAAPEPASATLLGIALVAVGAIKRRRS